MNLLEIRTQLVKISGRYDLVVDAEDYMDSGANFYIQNGQKHLERQLGITPTTGKVFQAMAIGDFLASFKNSRSVKSVWIIDENARTKVTKVTEGEMKALFPRYSNNVYAENPTFISVGRPQYYCTTNLRRAPMDEDNTGTDSPSLSSYLDTVSPADPTLSGVLLMPPADKAYTVEVVGLFYDSVLAIDTDENFWSDQYPMLLVRAALRELSVDYSSSKTSSDWDKIIGQELLGIEKDAIDQEIAEIEEMAG